MKILTFLFLIGNFNFISADALDRTALEFKKPFITSKNQEARVFNLKLTPGSIEVNNDFIGKPTNQTLIKLRHPTKRDKYVLRVLGRDEKELLILGIGNPFYAHAQHIGFENHEVMGGPVSSASIEIGIPINLDAKFIAISARDLNANLIDIQRIELR